MLTITMRKLTVKSSGEDIDWEVDYPNMSKAQQLVAAAGEKLGVAVKVATYKGNTFVTNVEEIHAALEEALE